MYATLTATASSLVDSLTVDVTCNCVNTGKCDNSECILKSAESWCYTIIRNFAGAITYQRGCTRKCKEYHNHYEMRTCCQGNKCNNETIPYTWPSVSSTVSTITPTKTSQYVPPSLIEGTPPPLVQPTTNSPDILTSEKPVTVDPQHPRQLTCYCSGCTDGSTTCLATVACASLIIESINMTWCIHDYFSCKNDSFLLNCCYKDYCNGPPQPSSGPPCDDEDMEQSGGCEFGKIFMSDSYMLVLCMYVATSFYATVNHLVSHATTLILFFTNQLYAKNWIVLSWQEKK